MFTVPRPVHDEYHSRGTWTLFQDATEVTKDDDEHITDVLQHVRTMLAENGKDNSRTLLNVATCNSSALCVFKDSDTEQRSPNPISLGSDSSGNSYYATSMTYTILREHAQGHLSGGYKGFISYVPMVLSGNRGVFLEPGNAWPVDTVGMVTLHLFENATQAPDLTHMSTLDAINHVLVALAGGSKRWTVPQKFLVGYNILEMLMKTIKSNGIALEKPQDIDCGAFNVDTDWRKMILVLVFDCDAEGLTSDIERLADLLDEWLSEFYDYANTWADETSRNALITFIARLYNDSFYGSYEYYMDLMYNVLDDIEGTFLPKGLKDTILGYKSELEDVEEKGYLEPLGFDAIRHNAGEFLTDKCVKKAGVASGIGYKAGLQPMVMPSLDFKFNVRLPGLRAKLKIVGEEITLESRQLTALAKEYQGRLTAFSVFGSGVSRAYVAAVDVLRGSMVANVALCGTLGPAAGLWILSHIIHGDLTVSENSLACYAKMLAVRDGKLKLSAPLSSDIMRSIHSVTDGESIYSIWHPNLAMKLSRRRGEWHASPPRVAMDTRLVKSCFITSRRPTASTASSAVAECRVCPPFTKEYLT